MKAAYRATKPYECWDWLTLRDVQRIGLQAWKRAKAGCYPPSGERWIVEGSDWSSPQDFAENLALLFVLHLQTEAHCAGIPGNEFAPAHLARWYGKDEAAGESEPGAGRSPADKGHGWPASAAAGGPGCEVDRLAVAAHGDALPCSMENGQ